MGILNEVERELCEVQFDDFKLFSLLAKYSHLPNPNIDVLRRFVFDCKIPGVVEAALSVFAEKCPTDEPFWSLIFMFIDGVDWDTDEDVKFSATYALRFYPFDDRRLADAVRTCLLSDDPHIRDAIAVVAQFKAGISPQNILWHYEGGSVIDHISPAARDWLEQRRRNHS